VQFITWGVWVERDRTPPVAYTGIMYGPPITIKAGVLVYATQFSIFSVRGRCWLAEIRI